MRLWLCAASVCETSSDDLHVELQVEWLMLLKEGLKKDGGMGTHDIRLDARPSSN